MNKKRETKVKIGLANWLGAVVDPSDEVRVRVDKYGDQYDLQVDPSDLFECVKKLDESVRRILPNYRGVLGNGEYEKYEQELLIIEQTLIDHIIDDKDYRKKESEFVYHDGFHRDVQIVKDVLNKFNNGVSLTTDTGFNTDFKKYLKAFVIHTTEYEADKVSNDPKTTRVFLPVLDKFINGKFQDHAKGYLTGTNKNITSEIYKLVKSMSGNKYGDINNALINNYDNEEFAVDVLQAVTKKVTKNQNNKVTNNDIPTMYNYLTDLLPDAQKISDAVLKHRGNNGNDAAKAVTNLEAEPGYDSDKYILYMVTKALVQRNKSPDTFFKEFDMTRVMSNVLNLMKDYNNKPNVHTYVLKDITDVPLYMRELFKGKMPVFMSRFKKRLAVLKVEKQLSNKTKPEIEMYDTLIKCIEDTLKHVEDNAMYFEVGTDAINDYRRINNTLPLMPFSSLVANKNYNTVDSKLESNDFKYQFGTRGVYGRLEKKMSLSDMPWMKELLLINNSHVSSSMAVQESDLNTIIRCGTDLLKHKLFSKHVNRTDATNPDKQGNEQEQGNERVEGGDNTDYSTVYQHSNVQKAIEITTSYDQQDQIRKIVSHVKKSEYNILPQREKLAKYNLLDLNIAPINVHALQRGIPLAPLYNYSYTFEHYLANDKWYLDNHKHNNNLNKYYKYPLETDEYNDLDWSDKSVSSRHARFIGYFTEDNNPQYMLSRFLQWVMVLQRIVRKKIEDEVTKITASVATDLSTINPIITENTNNHADQKNLRNNVKTAKDAVKDAEEEFKAAEEEFKDAEKDLQKAKQADKEAKQVNKEAKQANKEAKQGTLKTKREELDKAERALEEDQPYVDKRAISKMGKRHSPHKEFYY